MFLCLFKHGPQVSQVRQPGPCPSLVLRVADCLEDEWEAALRPPEPLAVLLRTESSRPFHTHPGLMRGSRLDKNTKGGGGVDHWSGGTGGGGASPCRPGDPSTLMGCQGVCKAGGLRPAIFRKCSSSSPPPPPPPFVSGCDCHCPRPVGLFRPLTRHSQAGNGYF